MKPTKFRKTEMLSTKTKNKNLKLQQHTQKIEQRLAKLKMEVDQKKNALDKNRFTATKDMSKKVEPKMQKRVSSGIVHPKNNIQTKQIELKQIAIGKDLKQFLEDLGYYSQYVDIFMENGIDSLAILQEIKQKQLEEIGIQKGHALKITIKLKKLKQSNLKYKNSEVQIVEQKPKTIQKPPVQPLQIIIQTEPIEDNQPLKKRRYFCLNCYKVTQSNFCDQNCQFMYNKMFEKYEKNLAKIQQAFSNKTQKAQVPEKIVDEKEYVDDLDILEILGEDEQNAEQFNQDQYLGFMKVIKEAQEQDKFKPT